MPFSLVKMSSAFFVSRKDDAMNVFEAVKGNVTTRQAAEMYGIRVNRHGMAVCPFHNDKNPSMKVDMRFHCFACQADGDAVDFVSIDCGTLKNGFYGDSAYTFEVGEVDEEIRKLLRVTKESLYKGIGKAVAGMRIGDIGHAVQSHCEAEGYSVVREMVGHGVGHDLHEEPQVPNYGRQGQGVKLKEGMVIAIEPMINLGKRHIYQEADGWTIRTRDKKPAAHFEHTVAVGKNSADILSTFEYVEQVLHKS